MCRFQIKRKQLPLARMSSPRMSASGIGSGRGFYSNTVTRPTRSRTNETPKSGGKSTPARSVSRKSANGHQTPTYAPGQNLLDYDFGIGGGSGESSASDNEDHGDLGLDAVSDMYSFSSFTTPVSRPRAQRNDNMTKLFCLLQQQQATLKHQGELLEENLRHQQVQSRKFEELEGRMLAYEERLDEVETATPNEPPRKKIKVTRDISVSKVPPPPSILFKNPSFSTEESKYGT